MPWNRGIYSPWTTHAQRSGLKKAFHRPVSACAYSPIIFAQYVLYNIEARSMVLDGVQYKGIFYSNSGRWDSGMIVTRTVTGR